MRSRGDNLYTSALTVGEILVKPSAQGAISLEQQRLPRFRRLSRGAQLAQAQKAQVDEARTNVLAALDAVLAMWPEQRPQNLEHETVTVPLAETGTASEPLRSLRPAPVSPLTVAWTLKALVTQVTWAVVTGAVTVPVPAVTVQVWLTGLTG